MEQLLLGYSSNKTADYLRSSRLSPARHSTLYEKDFLEQTTETVWQEPNVSIPLENRMGGDGEKPFIVQITTVETEQEQPPFDINEKKNMETAKFN